MGKKHVQSLLYVSEAPLRSTFLGEVARNFSDRETNTDGMVLLLLCLGAVLLLIFAVFLITRRLARRHTMPPLDLVVASTAVKGLLRRAMDERGRFEIQFSAGGTRRRSTYCTCAAVGEQSLTIECSNLTFIAPTWVGRAIEGYFRLGDKRGHVFFQFHATILAVRKPSDVYLLDITMPAELTRTQKRAFLRVAPPPDLLLGMAVWHLGQQLTAPPASAYDAGPPHTVYSPARHGGVKLINISGGGARLLFQPAPSAPLRFSPAKGDHLLLLLALHMPEDDTRSNIWVHCRVQNVFAMPDTRDVEAGVLFLAWHQAQQLSPAFNWTAAGDDGEVPPVAQWAMRRHVDLYRAVGVE